MKLQILIAVSLAISSIALAQGEPRLWIGGGAGYGLGLFSLSGPGTACNFDPACPQYSGGTGGGVLIGVSADWRLWNPYGILFRATYFGSGAAMKATTSDVMTRDMNGNLVPLVREHTLNLQAPEITIDLLASWKHGTVRVFAGPTGSIIQSPMWSSTATILSPSNVTFPSGNIDTVLLEKQPLTDARNFLIGLSAGVGMDFALSPRWNCSPEASFTFPFQSLRTTSTWKESSVRVLVNMRYAVDAPCEMRTVILDGEHADTIRIVKAPGTQTHLVKGIPSIDTTENTVDCEHRIIHTIHWTDTLYVSSEIPYHQHATVRSPQFPIFAFSVGTRIPGPWRNG